MTLPYLLLFNNYSIYFKKISCKSIYYGGNFMKLDLLIIDPQMDFCSPDGSLFVPGADKDCERAATMIRRLIPKINDIHVT